MTTTQQATIVGIFQDRAMAEQAVSELKQAGFSDNQIEFAGHGATTGGLLASLKSLFIGEDTITNNVYNDLTGMGMPSEDAHYYQQEYENGRSIVAVTDGNRLQEASTILTRSGGYGATRQSAQTANYASSTQTQATSPTSTVRTAAQETTANTGEERTMQLREEQLRVYKRPVQAGEVGLRKEVVAEQQTLNVPVTHEEVYIERHPVTDEAVDTTPIGQDETIRVPVREEQVNVTKQTVETGEVAIGKRQVQETQQVSDTIRREEAHIEREGDAPIHNTKTDPFHPSQNTVEDLLEDH